MTSFDRTFAFLILTLPWMGCTDPPAPKVPARPVAPTPPAEAAEKDPEFSPLKGCGMVTSDDNQGALDFRVVTTERYCDQSTADMDLHFTALVDKKTKKYPVILVNAVLVDPVETAYTTVRFPFRGKTVERKADAEDSEEFCRSAGVCVQARSVTFEVDRSVVVYWAEKGGVVRFGPGRELKIDPKEAADFLRTLDQLGAIEARAP